GELFKRSLFRNESGVRSVHSRAKAGVSDQRVQCIHGSDRDSALSRKIEQGNLRKNFQEPRVHFAVNCASIGCPALRPEAYTAAKLNTQLDEQARLFLRDTSRNRTTAANKRLELSMIFKWFHEDFERGG